MPQLKYKWPEEGLIVRKNDSLHNFLTQLLAELITL